MRCDSIFLKALFVLTFSLVAGVSHSAEESRRRSLELELEEIQGSSGYEVEVLRLLPQGKKSSTEKFSLKSTVWKATLSPGHYTMRVRSLDSRGVPGEWNLSKEFMVKLFAPKLSIPADLSVIKSEDSKEEKIKFQWEPGEKAQSYKIEVKDSKNKTVFQSDLKETTVTTVLPVGADYSWQVTPANADIETEGEPSPPHRFKIEGRKLDSPDILKITDVETKLLQWKPTLYAEKYEVQLELKSEEVFQKIKSWSLSQSAIKFDKALPSGTYRIRVKATAYDRLDSDESIKEFETVNSIGDDLRRANYQLKKTYFMKLGLGPGYFSYTNNSLDLDTNSSVAAYGVSAAVTLGAWLGSKLVWGLMATLEEQSIPLSGSSTTYGSVSLLGIRKFNLGSSSQIRAYAGVQRTEVPDVASDIYGNIQQAKVDIWGPTVKLAYYGTITSHLGFNFSAQLFASISGSAPTGASVSTQPSEQFGFGISRRLRENLMANIDYYYRIENAGYYHPSDFGFPNIQNGNNQVTLSSHNLMFSLELGF